MIDDHGVPDTTPDFADAASLDAQAMIGTGADRIGTSASAAILAALD